MDKFRMLLRRVTEAQDYSIRSVEELESELAARFPEDERFSELEHVLASYRPGGGDYYFGERELERACIKALNELDRIEA